MSRRGINREELMECLLGDEVMETLATKLETRLTSMIRLISDDLAKVFTAKMESMVAGFTEASFQKLSQEQNEKVGNLEKENSLLKAKLDDLENQTKLDNLIIYGIDGRSKNDTSTLQSASQHDFSSNDKRVTQSVINLCNGRLGLSITESDISFAHGISGNSKDPNGPILVRFTNRSVRNLIYSARKRLKGSSNSDPVYINEHLTRSNASLFAEARKMVKNKSITSTWTRGGLVYIRRSEDPNEKPRKVSSSINLQNINSTQNCT